MSFYYFDTSALVKRYVEETGSRWVTSACDSNPGNIIFTATISHVEAAAAVGIKHRTGGLSPEDYQEVLDNLAYDFSHHYVLVTVDEALIGLAVELTTRHRLRGYDAVQLAAALTVNYLTRESASMDLPFVFVSSDRDLLRFARSEGLDTQNPLDAA